MKLKLASLIISLFALPFSLYLTYLMLTKISSTDLMWFLFWMIVPIDLVVTILSKLAEWEED